MPIYNSDEHEIMKSDATLIDHGVKVSDGTLYLSNSRVIYERKGKKKLFKAIPPRIDLELKLTELKDAAGSEPKLKFWAKRILTITYERDNATNGVDFVVEEPDAWARSIQQWASEAKRRYTEKSEREKEDEKKREIEMARAKTPGANINILYNESKKKQQSRSPNYVESENGEDLPAETKTCPSCGAQVPADARYCYSCGHQF
ncbi:zinc ribbon domain-containing protein [Oxyplasma meridianum]|uniref:Zinc ribbon domain-containing protein n=1 Tax=Oxyplasma meridianum TaxID=3073602 RepID=A0AAX4NF52_9ARCH